MSYRNNNPYPHGGSGFNESSTGFIQPPRQPPPKKGISPWIKYGVPVFIVIAIAAVVGGILGSRKASSSSSNNGAASGGSNGSNGRPTTTGAIATATDKFEAGRFAVETNSLYMVPVYPSATNTALFGPPTVDPNAATWPTDSFSPPNPSPLEVRPDRPRLIAPRSKWDALPELIASDPYLRYWNETIFINATTWRNEPPMAYDLDGPNGVLDNARRFKAHTKAWAYAYLMTGQTEWVDRLWVEIQHVTGPDFGPQDATKWNPDHFLDVAEFAAAFGIAYDWVYPAWTEEQRTYIRDSVIEYALNNGRDVYEGAAPYGWWRGDDITGNWNCVCNGGLTLASLAILGDDTTGVAEYLLQNTVPNARSVCVNAVQSDGTWAESPNYWYFGTTGHAEMASALITATGSDHGLLNGNPSFMYTGIFHMYVTGATTLFEYADTGPNKFSTTANAMFLYGDRFNRPEYSLFQRDRADTSGDPWAILWYNPATSGAFWNGLDLDHFFEADLVQFASMRSSWTDINALFVGIKGGANQGHQAHNDLDAGDFVLDAMGVRWAGEFGNGDYKATDYFASEDQDAVRWQYYRKATMGQNTLVVGRENQNALNQCVARHGSSQTTQGSSTVFTPPLDSTAFWTVDMSSAYTNADSVHRGARMLNGRRQVLLQDEINTTNDVEWRMHTNATVTLNGASADLEIDGRHMTATILNPSGGMVFGTTTPERNDSNVPAPADGDMPNPGVTVLTIAIPAGQHTVAVLFTPQWEGVAQSEYVTNPPSVALADWDLRTHD